MSNFKIGETVVCIEDHGWESDNPNVPFEWINKGRELTISNINEKGNLAFVGLDQRNFYGYTSFEKKSSNLSMDFKNKVYEERKVLILKN